ncbi:MAG: peptidoglycan-binding domain-containing protein [Verrucomicrobiota bacterium]
MNKLLLFSALAVTLAAPLALADDALRGAQVTLRNAGYYNGPVDGELNADTKAALRRYQIRNQLEPSGELTAETAAALAKESGQAAAPAPEAPPAPVPPAPAATTPLPPPVDPGYAALFDRTPYQNAAQELQCRTARQAQIQLGQRGFYRGEPDGQPNHALQKALLRFQDERRLPPTGRLDIDTLAELHLLPVAKLPRPRTAPVPYEAPVPSGVPGAVRGVPVD